MTLVSHTYPLWRGVTQGGGAPVEEGTDTAQSEHLQMSAMSNGLLPCKRPALVIACVSKVVSGTSLTVMCYNDVLECFRMWCELVVTRRRMLWVCEGFVNY